MNHYLVLEDPRRAYRQGTVLTDAQAREASVRGVALIPVDPNIYGGAQSAHSGSAVSGFFRADYGVGWQMPQTAGPLVPLSLCLKTCASAVHWRAAVWIDTPDRAYGQLRLTADSSQYGLPVAITSEQVNLEPFADNVANGKKVVVVGGMSFIPLPPGGMSGFCLWGCGGGRVLWAAISQTMRPSGSYTVNPLSLDESDAT